MTNQNYSLILHVFQISVPFRSSEECRIHLDVIIKKIRRTRSLAEILSDLDVYPIDKKELSSHPVQNSILKDIKNVMKDNDSRDRNNNATMKGIIKRRSKRLSQANKRHCSSELTQER